MSWRVDSNSGATIWDTEPMTRDDLKLRDEELDWLVRNKRPWKLINGRIARSGDSTFMAEGTYGALAAYPLPVSEAALTLSATEQGLIPAAHIPIYTPLPINGMLAPQAYRFIATGIFTSVATSGNLTTSIRIGNANTSPLLRSSVATAMTASLTNGQWYLMGDITIRTIGLPGANSTAIATFHQLVNTAVGGACSSIVWGTGVTAVSFDSTIAAAVNGGGIWLGELFSANFPTMTLQQVHMMDWN